MIMACIDGGACVLVAAAVAAGVGAVFRIFRPCDKHCEHDGKDHDVS